MNFVRIIASNLDSYILYVHDCVYLRIVTVFVFVLTGCYAVCLETLNFILDLMCSNRKSCIANVKIH